MISIIYGVLLLFVLAGFFSFIYLLLLFITRPKFSGHFLVVIPAMSSERDITALLRAARLRVGLFGDFSHSEIIALDCGLSERSRLQCDKLCGEFEHTSRLTPEEFLDKIYLLFEL